MTPRTPTIAADPYRLALRRRPAPRQHGADRHRHADRLLRPGRLCRPDGLRHLADPRADRADPAPCSPPCAPGGYHVIHTREGHRPDLADLPPTSAGARAGSAPASAIPGPCGRILVRGEPGWEIIPELAPLPGETDHRQARQGLVLRHRPRADPAHSAASTTSCSPASPPTSASTPPCARPTTAASSACCSRTAAAPPTAATTSPPIKMVKMQGGVFGAVATSAAFLEGLP